MSNINDRITLPDCMMTDGAEPCKGFMELEQDIFFKDGKITALQADKKELEVENVRLDRLIESQRQNIIKHQGERDKAVEALRRIAELSYPDDGLPLTVARWMERNVYELAEQALKELENNE